MAENRGMGSRLWTRATLLARLTIAGVAAAMLLSLVFGFGLAALQEKSARSDEEARVRVAAQHAFAALNRDIFATSDPNDKDYKRFLQSHLQSDAELLDSDGIAVFDGNGELLARNRNAPGNWPSDLMIAIKEAKAEGKIEPTPRADAIEVVIHNTKADVWPQQNPTEEDEKARNLAVTRNQAMTLAISRPYARELAGTKTRWTLLEAFVSAVLLLVILLWVVRREVAGPVVELSKIVSDLARTGELAPARTSLARFGLNGGSAHDQNELRALIGGFDALLASLERLANQANAIARDDLWNECFDKENETRGDLAISFRKMVSMLRDLSIRVGRIARGDLTVPASAPGQKEGSLGSAFREMTEKLKLLLDELAGAGSKIDKAARGLQESSRDQASTATQQAAAVTETMATMEELAASSGHIADTAKHVVTLADETLASARGGQASVTDVGGGMEEIVAASRQGAHRLLDLGEKSRAIGKVAELITGIAERSKILALNAAIEAARAGEAGRGFSVVADEVRSLADHVVESTREIEGLIGQIQGEISAAVLASEEEVKRAEKGRELAMRAQASLQAITDTASKTTEAARQIELATNQQRSASGQVATAVREVATSSEEVATGAKRVTVSANELAALAHDLQAVINQFDSATDERKGASGPRSASRSGQAPKPTPAPPSTFDAEALRRG
jgi:methyl-accepting chemotaxis protein